MPAGATFKRLHDIIQNVTNFQSGYPHDGYHLYEFDLTEENRIVTDQKSPVPDTNLSTYCESDYQSRKTQSMERLTFQLLQGTN